MRGSNGIWFSMAPTVIAEPLEDGAVPLRIALGEVVVDRDEVHVRRPSSALRYSGRLGDERLSLTRLHLGDVALVEHDAAHQLNVEEPLTRLALARLAHRRERLVEDVVERFAVCEPLPELGRLRVELLRR